MTLSDINLCSAALTRLGAASIAAFDEGTAESEVASQLYPPARDYLLSVFYWSFARAQSDLALKTASPLADYAYAYDLPNLFIRAERLGDRRGGRRPPDYQILENRLHTDIRPAILTYTFRAPESGWPAFFREAMIARLAADFCMPVTENAGKQELLEQIADLRLRAAKLADSQQDTPEALSDFPLIAVR